jgi:MbtH protein
MTMPSPFEPTDDPEDEHLLLVNAAGQQSVWPAFAAIPAGWTVHAPAEPQEEDQR